MKKAGLNRFCPFPLRSILLYTVFLYSIYNECRNMENLPAIFDFESIKKRLDQVIQPIVSIHKAKGDTLSWKLMHEIEDRAFHILAADTSLDPALIKMCKSSSLMKYPQTDEAVDFGQSDAIPFAFSVIYAAYSRLQ
jgi:hypothetical protein